MKPRRMLKQETDERLHDARRDVVFIKETQMEIAKKEAIDQPSWFSKTLGFEPFSYQQEIIDAFNVKLLGSESYILKVLEKLSPRKLRQLRDVFAKNHLSRLMKEISVNRHKAFATRAEYIAGLETADMVKLASLIRVVGLLLQVKAYLFWQK
jgi:hypothetical protein